MSGMECILPFETGNELFLNKNVTAGKNNIPPVKVNLMELCARVSEGNNFINFSFPENIHLGQPDDGGDSVSKTHPDPLS